MTVVSELFAKLGLDVDEKAFDAGDRLLSGLKYALVGIAFHRGWSFLKESLHEVVDGVSHAVDASAKLGITAEAYQELGYAASLAGSSAGAVETAMRMLARSMENAKHGGAAQAKAFKDVGLSMQDAAVKSGDLDSVFMKVEAGLAGIKDVGKRTKAAMGIFSRAGVELIPMAEGLAEARKEAHELGVVVDNETSASVENFGDQMDKLTKFSVLGLKNEVVKALLPTLKKLVEASLVWIKANRQILAQKLAFVFKGLIAALIGVGWAISKAIDALQWMSKHLGLVAVAALGLIGALVLLKGASVTAAIASAAAWAISVIEIGLIALAVVAAIIVFDDLYHSVKDGEGYFADLYRAAKKWIGDKLFELIGDAKQLVDEFLHPNHAKGLSTSAKAIDTNTVGVQRYTATSHADDRFLKMQEKSEAGMSAPARILARLARAANLQKLSSKQLSSENDWNGSDADRNDFRVRSAKFKHESKILTQSIGTLAITVNVPAGADANGVGQAVAKHVDSWWERQLRQMQSGTGAGSVP